MIVKTDCCRADVVEASRVFTSSGWRLYLVCSKCGGPFGSTACPGEQPVRGERVMPVRPGVRVTL